MASFTEHTVECNRCEGRFKIFGSSPGLSIMYRNMIFSLCEKCTDEVLSLMGTDRQGVMKQYGRYKEIESEAKLRDDIKHGYLCVGCKGPFQPHHHKHVTRKGTYHSSCYEKREEDPDNET